MTYNVEKELGHHPKPSEDSAFWYAKGIGFVLHQPIDFVKLLVKKLYLFWNALEIPNNLDFYTFSQYSLLLRVMPVGFWCVGPLGAVGMILCWKRRRGRMIVALVMMYCFVMVLFFVCDRYRLPVVLLLCLFAAYALETLFGWFRRKDYRPVVLYGALLAPLALAMNSNLYHLPKEEPVHQFYMLGLIEQQHGDYGPASSHFAKAASYGKPMRNVYLHWGECEAALGHGDEAKENFRRELLYHPDSYGALADLSALFLAGRMLDSAILYGTRAIPIKPFMPVAYVSVGQAFTMLHDLARAESVLAEGSAKCGAEFRYGNYLLAGVYLEQGKIEKAELAYRSALLPPRSERADYEPAYLIPEEKKMGIDEQTLRAKVLYGLGHVFVSRRQLDSAAACFRAATTASPSLADAWADLGVALLQTHAFPSAETAMREALRLQPDNFMYWYNYGSLLGAMKRFDEARQAFEKTLSFRPDFQPARKDLEVLTRVSGK